MDIIGGVSYVTIRPSNNSRGVVFCVGLVEKKGELDRVDQADWHWGKAVGVYALCNTVNKAA
jgi:hypothetical protein